MSPNDLELFRATLSILSGLFVFVFYGAILREALKKIITPNPVSWLIWSLNDALILFASWSAGAWNTLAVPLIYAIFGWFIVIAALRNERRMPNTIETICLAGAVLGWVCYLLSFGSFTSLVIAITVNTLGGVPTMIRLVKNPRAERFRSWILVWIGSALSLASLEQFQPVFFLFPVNSLVLTSVIILLMLRPVPTALIR